MKFVKLVNFHFLLFLQHFLLIINKKKGLSPIGATDAGFYGQGIISFISSSYFFPIYLSKKKKKKKKKNKECILVVHYFIHQNTLKTVLMENLLSFV